LRQKQVPEAKELISATPRCRISVAISRATVPNNCVTTLESACATGKASRGKTTRFTRFEWETTVVDESLHRFLKGSPGAAIRKKDKAHNPRHFLQVQTGAEDSRKNNVKIAIITIGVTIARRFRESSLYNGRPIHAW